jgi:CBS domain-containing protein
MPATVRATEPLPLVTASDLVNPLLKVSDIMTAAPRTCSPSSTLLEAALLMRDAECGVIPVTQAGLPVGILTDRDIAMALPDRGADLTSTPVSEVMSDRLVTVDRDAPLDAAMEKLGAEGVRRVLAVDAGGLLVGVLSWTDLVPHLSERAIGRVVSHLVENR